MNTIFDLNDYKAPFVNSSFYELLKINKKDEKFTKYSDEINKFGYTIVDLKINDEAIDTINIDIDRLINSTEFKRNSNFYHYNKSPRIVEGWKHSDGIKKIINNKFLNDLLDTRKCIVSPLIFFNIFDSKHFLDFVDDKGLRRNVLEILRDEQQKRISDILK